MSFTLLDVGIEKRMSGAEVYHHSIDQFGNSELPEYSDSIFSVIKLEISKHKSKEPIYLITRILKKDLELPFDQPVLLSGEKAAALRIRLTDGCSDRPDLSAYKFTCKYNGDNVYEVTKHNKV